jgi:glycerol-3-phosphate acyltransferase PlsY
MTWLIALIPLAYVLGSIPFGLVIGKRHGVDVRLAGSKNIGATNVARVLGHKKYFFQVFFLDLAKSFVPMLVASMIVRQIPLASRDRTVYLLWLLVGFAAVLGHMFSMFLKFKGGKGVATSAGLMLGLIPYYALPGLLAVIVFVLVFFPTRYISLGSIVAACAFPVLFLLLGKIRAWDVWGAQLPLAIFAFVIALLIVWKHRTNISRLLAGTENRFKTKSE